jgi:hypothetical protein
MKKFIVLIFFVFLFSCEKEDDQCWDCVQQQWITFIDVVSNTVTKPRFYSSDTNGSIQCGYTSKSIITWAESQYYESVYVKDGTKRLTEHITVCTKSE